MSILPPFTKKLQTIAEKSVMVHEAGKKAQYDEFWEDYLAESKSTKQGASLFSGRGWTTKTFNPPEKIDWITNAYQMFAYAGNISKEKLAMVDYSKFTVNMSNIFTNTNIVEIPPIDTRGMSTLASTFMSSIYLETIEKLILKDDGSQTFNGVVFAGCSRLKNLTIEGTIGQNGFSVADCIALSKASIKSIIDHLSSTTSDLTVTLSKTAVNNAFGVMGEHSAEWMDLRDTKKNWTISLV